MLKEFGIVYEFNAGDPSPEIVRPRINERPPKPGYCNPARKNEIVQLLEFLGPEAMDGLRLIEYVQYETSEASALPPLGRPQVPGHVLLYQQPLPPWRLSGILSANEIQRFHRAGAIIDTRREIEVTVVDWPGHTLRDFFSLTFYRMSWATMSCSIIKGSEWEGPREPVIMKPSLRCLRNAAGLHVWMSDRPNERNCCHPGW